MVNQGFSRSSAPPARKTRSARAPTVLPAYQTARSSSCPRKAERKKSEKPPQKNLNAPPSPPRHAPHPRGRSGAHGVVWCRPAPRIHGARRTHPAPKRPPAAGKKLSSPRFIAPARQNAIPKVPGKFSPFFPCSPPHPALFLPCLRVFSPQPIIPKPVLTPVSTP